jgi:hypothetical protein
MPCAEQDLLRQEHRAAVHNFRAAIRDLVLLVDNSAADSNFNLAHRRIKAARRACEVARDAIENHQEKHGCWNSILTPMNYSTLHELSIHNLSDFLNIEADLVMTFAGLARRYRETGNSARYEISKRNAFAAVEAINHFKNRLPDSIRTQIETRLFELIEIICTLWAARVGVRSAAPLFW